MPNRTKNHHISIKHFNQSLIFDLTNNTNYAKRIFQRTSTC